MATEAEIYINHGRKYPYHDKPPTDWAEVAALGVLANLCDRRGVKHELRDTDQDVKEEIVSTLAEIIRTSQGKPVEQP